MHLKEQFVESKITELIPKPVIREVVLKSRIHHFVLVEFKDEFKDLGKLLHESLVDIKLLYNSSEIITKNIVLIAYNSESNLADLLGPF